MAEQNDEFAPTNPAGIDEAPKSNDDDIFRPMDAPAAESDAEATRVQEAANPQADAIRAEQERLAAERAARKEARQAALAPLSEPVLEDYRAQAEPTPVPAKPVKRSTDKFSGSLGLFLLRWATAAVVGVRGVQTLLEPNPLTEIYANTVLPRPELVAIGLGAALTVAAVLLFFGAMTRFAGLLLAAVAGVSLAFVQWGSWSPFVAGKPGFLGEFDLLLAGIGLLFLFVGAGGWSVDYGFRRRRQADRLAREQLA